MASPGANADLISVTYVLGDPVHEVQAGHLLVTHLGVHADHLGVVERGDEGERMADGRQHGFQRFVQSQLASQDFGLENHAYETVAKVATANTEVGLEMLIPMPAECGLGVVAVYEDAVYIEQDVSHRVLPDVRYVTAEVYTNGTLGRER